MKYERLTNSEYFDDETIDIREQENIYYRLQDLEDKIEAGTLIELPFAIGTIVYAVCVDNETDELYIRITDVVGYEVMRDELWVKTSLPYRKSYVKVDNVFLTKAEAEKRLEELRGEL